MSDNTTEHTENNSTAVQVLRQLSFKGLRSSLAWAVAQKVPFEIVPYLSDSNLLSASQILKQTYPNTALPAIVVRKTLLMTFHKTTATPHTRATSKRPTGHAYAAKKPLKSREPVSWRHHMTHQPVNLLVPEG